MTIVPVGIHIDTSTAAEGVRNLDALVPAAERVERASDKMVAAILADLKAVNEQGFARMSAAAEASLVALNKLGQAKPTEHLPTDVQRSADAFDRLKASIDPVFRAELQLAQAQKTVDAALKAGAINAEQAADAMRQFAVAQGAVGRAGGSFGWVQNAAFQLGDFAVQVGAGTSAATAFAQQAPQLLGGLGVVGAVAGAVVAIAAPLASSFLFAGEGAQTLSDRSDNLTMSSERLQAALDDLGQTNTELAAKYGENAQAMREVMDLQAGLAQADFGSKMREQAAATAAALDEWRTAAIPDEAAQYLDLYTQNLYAVQQALGATGEAASVVVERIEALGNASTIDEQTQASLDLARAMAEAVGGAQNLSGAALEMYEALLAASRAGFSASAGIEAAGASADSAAAQIRNATAAYYEFQQLRRLGEEADARARAKALGTTEDSRNSADRGVYLSYEDRLGLDRKDPRNPNYSPQTSRKSGGGGRSGGGGKSEASQEAERAARELEREKEARQKVIEGLQFEISMLGKSDEERRIATELRKAHTDATTDEGKAIAGYITQLESAEEAEKRLTAIQEYAADTGADLFLAATQGADSFGEAIRNVAAELAQMAAQQAFMTLFMGQGGKGGVGGGIFQSILGSVLGGGMPVTGSFANGTPAVYATGTSNHPGGPAIINDRGGEIVDLPSGARVYPHDVSMRMAQAQSRDSTHVTVGVEVDGDGSIRAFVKDQVTKSEKRAVRTSVGAVRKGDATSHNFWKRG